jgi:hypothetical protein
MPTEAREPCNLDQGTRDVTKKVRLTDGEAGLPAGHRGSTTTRTGTGSPAMR